MQYANPSYSLILSIEGATDQPCQEIPSRSKYNIFTSYHCLNSYCLLCYKEFLGENVLYDKREHEISGNRTKLGFVVYFLWKILDNWAKYCYFFTQIIIYYTYSSLYPQNRYKELFPNTHFYMSLYSRFCGCIGITFHVVTF